MRLSGDRFPGGFDAPQASGLEVRDRHQDIRSSQHDDGGARLGSVDAERDDGADIRGIRGGARTDSQEEREAEGGRREERLPGARSSAVRPHGRSKGRSL